MRRAVAFAKDIKAPSQASQSFSVLVERAMEGDGHTPPAAQQSPVVQSRHVDGTMGVQERNKHLAWLKEYTDDGVCRVLTNALPVRRRRRPRAGGGHVPDPRGSQVDIVQAVGRVVRKAPRQPNDPFTVTATDLS